MYYRGYEITATTLDNQIMCQIYNRNDKEQLESVDDFCLRLGEDIPDFSKETVQRAIRAYVDETRTTLRALDAEIADERKAAIIGKFIRHFCNDKPTGDIYRLLSDTIGMTDAEMLEVGCTYLEPHFNRESYAETIANHMVMMGTECTTDCKWEFFYRTLNEWYGTTLPQDRDLMERIRQRLTNDYPETVLAVKEDDLVIAIRFNLEQCPYSDPDEDQVNDMITAEDLVEQAMYAAVAPDCYSDGEQAANMLGMLGANIMDDDIYHDEDEHPGMVPSM